MKNKLLRLETLEISIWICWLIACLTRNNWIVCAVCAVGFIANVLFAKNTKKPLKYIINRLSKFVRKSVHFRIHSIPFSLVFVKYRNEFRNIFTN